MSKLLLLVLLVSLTFTSCQEKRNIYAVIYEGGGCTNNDYEVEEVFFTYSQNVALQEVTNGYARVEVIKLNTNMSEEYLYVLEEYNENNCQSDFRIIEITEKTQKLAYIILDKNSLKKL
jgi:hypothetical protein